MIKLEGIETFVAIADRGSLSEAARTLGLSPSVISERLAELERLIGARLVHRTTRRMTLTEDGRVFLTRARRIARDVLDATAEMAERRGELVGSLRISAPVSLGYLHLAPALFPFLRQNPGVELTLDLDDRFVDAEADGYDAVIRHGPIRDSWLIAVHIAQSCRALVASPAYLAASGMPATIDDLRQHRAILYTNRIADWRFIGPRGKVSVHPKIALRVNNGLVMRDAAVAGLGLTLLPNFLTHAATSDGTLVKVKVDMEPEQAEIHLARPKSHQPSAILRALIEHMKQELGTPPYWDVA